MAEVLEYVTVALTAVGTAAAVYDVKLKTRKLTEHEAQPSVPSAIGMMSQPATDAAPGTGSPPAAGQKFCMQCGKQTTLEAANCESCGFTFADITEKPRLGWTFSGFVPWGLFGFMYGAAFIGLMGFTQQILMMTGAVDHSVFWSWVAGFFSFFYIGYVGVMGRKLAWKKQQWPSAAVFNSVMRRWEGWGIAFFIFNIFIMIFVFMSGVAEMQQQQALQLQQLEQQQSSHSSLEFDDPYGFFGD